MKTKVGLVCIGIGGCGCRNVDFIHKLYNIEKYILMDTDYNSLQMNTSEVAKYMPFVRDVSASLIGEKSFEGLGVNNHNQGEQAATESRKTILEVLRGVELVFIVVGLGGGTGTGAAPVVASFAKELGVKIICVVTMPFEFEGENRRHIANDSLEKLKHHANYVVIFENEDIFMSELSVKASQTFKLRYADYRKNFQNAFTK